MQQVALKVCIHWSILQNLNILDISGAKGDIAFPWISALPLLELLLNMHTTSYMSVITIHETNALREVS